MKYFFVCSSIIVLLQTTAWSQNLTVARYSRTEASAREIIQKTLQTAPVIDGHNDLFVRYMDCKTCPRGLDSYRLDSTTTGHTDIPRLRKGGVGGMLINVFGSDSTQRSYLQAWDLLHEIENRYSDHFKVVASSIEMRSVMQQKKIALLPSLEGAVRLRDDTALLRRYYMLGLRSVTFAYRTNGLADGSDDTARHNGLSLKGKEMVRAMNRLGILIDMSHISAKSMNDILDVSTAPVIFSHSNARALCVVNRNVPDDVLLRLKKNGGIIMLTFVPYFTSITHSKWMDAGDSVYYKSLKDFPGEKSRTDSTMEKWESDNPEPVVAVADIADHFDYVKKLIGVDHIGIAGDFDGIPFVIKGLENAGTYPNLLVELARRGWTEKEIKKVAAENFLRVFAEVEKKGAGIK